MPKSQYSIPKFFPTHTTYIYIYIYIPPLRLCASACHLCNRTLRLQEEGSVEWKAEKISFIPIRNQKECFLNTRFRPPFKCLD
jgi:hypothetical protein